MQIRTQSGGNNGCNYYTADTIMEALAMIAKDKQGCYFDITDNKGKIIMSGEHRQNEIIFNPQKKAYLWLQRLTWRSCRVATA